ncbi:Cna B-type domain-containing protein [Lactococcus lactis]|uniref:lectin-like domain-containing protein n=1 Tax=Lactococcus lactis TaxID=1358 RepID=UPI00241885F7|nr:Cna B-type domain-containing protein [Lactococcus lactis]MDG4967162.1 Cna B-type domain-containing protein [Lactococcus lactis]
MEKKFSLISLLTLGFSLLTQVVALPTVKADNIGGLSKTSSSIHVDPNNFLDYFNLNGSATYDGSGIVTLTPDSLSQAGNATLKTRIDMSQSFTLEGEINLGTKSQDQGGADGIGLGFHSQESNSVGVSGGALGIGGLQGAFGWKADTFYNNNQSNIGKDPSGFGPSPGSRGKAFGSFMYNDASTGTIITKSDDASAQAIKEPSVNTFRSITMHYDGTSKTMTVVYDGQTWSRDVSSWINDGSLSFLISASTGYQTNLQQFRIKSFDYTPVGEIVTKYVDKFTGAEIVPGELLTGVLGTTEGPLKNLESSVLGLGYAYDSTVASNAAYYDQTTDTGTYSNNQLKVTYYYTKGQIQIHKIDVSTGEDLSGAEFDIYDMNGNIVDHVTVDESGFGLSKVLPDGSYTLKETKAPIGYELSTQSYQATLNYGEEGKTIVELTITNKKFSETVNINGTKTWEDENDKDKIRPNSIKVNLFADDERIKNIEVTAESGWKYSFENLPKYNTSGEEIIYTITEDKVEGYQTTIEGFDITNTHHVKPTKPSITKPSTSGNNNTNINVHDTINSSPSKEKGTDLPRTGDKSSVWWVALGIFITLGTLGFYILKIKNSSK